MSEGHQMNSPEVVIELPPTIDTLKNEFFILTDRRTEFEEGSSMYDTFSVAIQLVLEQAVVLDPSLQANLPDRTYKATYWKPETKRKGLLK